MKLLGSLTAALAVSMAMTVLAPANNAVADEYFIPKGHLFQPGTNRVPYNVGKRAEIEAQTDILETEIYRKKQADRAFYEHFRTFIDRDLFYPGRSYSDY